MDIEQDKILHKASNYWGSQIHIKVPKQQYLNSAEQETVASASSSILDQEPKKDFIERIFNKSANIWSNLFCPQKESQPNSRKMSGEIQLGKNSEDEEDFNLFQRQPSDFSPEHINKPDLQENEKDLLDFVEDSHPIFANPYYTSNQEQSDSQCPNSLFYLDDEQVDEYQAFLDQNPPQLIPRQSLDSLMSENVNNYQLQNVTDSKIRLRRFHINQSDWTIRRKPFGQKEDQLIIELLKEHGRDFKLIAQRLPGRTEQMVKNRFKFKIRKLIKNTQNMDTESTQKDHHSSQSINPEQPFELLQIQLILKNQFLKESFSSQSSDLEKLQKIKQLQAEIEKIENLLHSTKSEIIKEYLAILQQKSININNNIKKQ